MGKKMIVKLTKDQINNIKISNVYDISILGMDFMTLIQILMYGMGFIFALPGLIEYGVLYFGTEQDHLVFLEQYPIMKLADSIMMTGVVMIGAFFVYFNIIVPILLSDFSKTEGLIESSRTVKKIIYKGKKVKAKIIDKNSDKDISIKGKSRSAVLYKFESEEFGTSYYRTLNLKLDLKRKLDVYWHPKYPSLVIPAPLVDS